MMRTFVLVGSLIALLMYVGFAAQQTGATVTGAPLHTSVGPVHVPDVGQPQAAAEPSTHRFAPFAFLTDTAGSCQVEGAAANAGR